MSERRSTWSPHTRVTHRLRALSGNTYALLLVLLLLFAAMQSANTWDVPLTWVLALSQAALGVAVVFVVFQTLEQRRVMLAMVLLALAIGAVLQLTDQSPTSILTMVFHALLAAYMAAALVEILRQLLQARAAGGGNVLGAICGYLLAGNALAQVNSLAYGLYPAAFEISADVQAQLASLQGRTALFTYYSFGQMLTLGDSAVNPVLAPATTLSLFGALFGVFYTAIVVAQLVGLGQASRESDGGSDA